MTQFPVDDFYADDFEDFFLAVGLLCAFSCLFSFGAGIFVGRWCPIRARVPLVAGRAPGRLPESAVTPSAGKRRHSTPPSLARAGTRIPVFEDTVRRTLSFHEAAVHNEFPVPILGLQ